MATTSINLISDRTVRLTYQDSDGEQVVREFWIPLNGGYVREDRGGDRTNDSQVCNGLAYRGHTLEARDGAELLNLIRSEWKSSRNSWLGK